QGLSQRAIAQAMGMPEATLRNNLKVLAQSIGEGLPMGNQGPPDRVSVEVHPGSPEVSHQGLPEGDLGTPPLYIHPAIPDDGEESVVAGEDIEGLNQAIPALPQAGIHEGDQGPPVSALSQELTEALSTAWPELQRMLDWWRT